MKTDCFEIGRDQARARALSLVRPIVAAVVKETRTEERNETLRDGNREIGGGTRIERGILACAPTARVLSLGTLYIKYATRRISQPDRLLKDSTTRRN